MVESCFEPISISTRTLLNIFPTDASENDIQCNFAQLFGVVPDGVYAQIILRLNCSDIYAHTLHRKYSHLGSGSPSDLTHFRGGFPKLEKRAPGDRTWKPVPHFAAYERSQEFVKLKWTARISPKPFRWSQPGGWSRSRKGKGMKTQKYCRLLLLFSRLVIYEMEVGARAVILLHPRFRSWWNCGRPLRHSGVAFVG